MTHQYQHDPAATPQSILEAVYGYSEFRGNQLAIIENTVNGHDGLVIMPTGGGKSLCYQIPALLRPGTGIVVSPLIALMQDQVSTLEQLGVRAAFLNSSLDSSAQADTVRAVKSGEVDLLYVAPERLLQAATLQWLSACDIAVIAIDEAHCVSQWGHDFRADYLQLQILSEHFADVPRLALTATATPRAQKDIIERLDLHQPTPFVVGFDRPNIRYTVKPKADGRKQLAAFLATHREQAGIIYCLSRKQTESTADWLNSRNMPALPYHAGLSSEMRAAHQARFLREDGLIMVATVAFGMGIDKPDVRFVVHMNLPKSIESYYQETGRAGRDGEPADAMMLYGLDDVVQLTRFIDQAGASDAHKRGERDRLDTLLGWCELTDCRRQPLLAYFGDDTHPSQQSGCGNCDNCLTPPKTWDGTEAAQKFLSCVYRTEQRFGVMHLIDVLRGKDSDKVQQFNHHDLSVFGLGKDLSQQQWRSIARQLLVRNLIRIDADRYNAVVLQAGARDLLKGNVALQLREEVLLTKSKSAARSAERQTRHASANGADPTLWEALRNCRKQLADEHDIPPYMVFHDATLMEMMEQLPQNRQELLALNGVGESKLDKFGQAFLDVIQLAAA